MNRIVRTTLVLVLSALVVLSFASCQSGAATEETVEIVAVRTGNQHCGRKRTS